jgi:hypothetical protein
MSIHNVRSAALTSVALGIGNKSIGAVDPSISGESRSRGSKGSRGREQRRRKEGTGFASDNM